MPDKVLFSTDIGSDIDDVLSLLAMFNSGIDVDGIYSVNGDVSSRARIAKHMVDLSGKIIEVGVGESKPIGGTIEPYTYFEEYYVDNKFIEREESLLSKDIKYKSLRETGINPKGLEAMAERLFDSPRVVFNTGPLTNIARLIDEYPESARNITHLYFMGCRFGDKSHEHNIRFDIPAAIKVFESSIPITVVSGDVCSRYRMPFEQLGQLKSEAGKYVKRMAYGFVAAGMARDYSTAGLKSFLENDAKTGPNHLRNEPNRGEILKTNNRIRELLRDIDDSYFAALDPEGYFKNYYTLLELFRNPKLDIYRGDAFANVLEVGLPKDISISDVYVPYCYLRPDKIKAVRANVQVDANGYSYREKGNRHTIITDLDFEDFREFTVSYLR